MKHALLALALISATPALGQIAQQPRVALSLEQRRAEFTRSCQLMAPEAWLVGEANRAAWLAGCKREAP